MADWNASNITLTTKGSSALSRVESGDGSLTITRVVASEQYVQESTLREVTTLSVENLELTIIDRHEVEDGGSVIQAQLSNLNLEEKFKLNEIGVFATHSSDPSNEFLYIIAQVNLGTGDEIPLYSVTPVTATYDIYLYNVGADKVNVTISSAGLVTYEALNAICGLVKRSNAYELGQIANHASLPTGMYLECVVAGTTASTPIPIPTSPKEGDMVKDGSVTWVLSKTLSSRKLGYRQPSTSYIVGAIAHHATLPTGWYLECTTAGETGSGALTITSPTVGGTVSDGTVTWKVMQTLSTAGGILTGDTLKRNVSSSEMNIMGGDSNLNGGWLLLHGKDSSDGSFGLYSSDGSSRVGLEGNINGRLLKWDNNSLDKSAVVAESLENNGYRKYASGLLVQWGTVQEIVENNARHATFPIAFTNKIFRIIVMPQFFGYGEFYIKEATWSDITIGYTSNSYQSFFDYYAIGY